MERVFAILFGPTLVEGTTLERAVAAATLLAVRLGPLAVATPILQVRAAPAMVRTTVLLALVLGLLPTALASAPVLPVTTLDWTLAALHEALLGTTFALAAAIPFFALDQTGRLVDAFRGATQSELTLPSGERTSALGGTLGIFALALYAAVGGHRVLVLALASHLRALPLGAAAPSDLRVTSTLAETAQLLTHSLTLGVSLAAPVVVALVAADVGLALVARTAPQLPVYTAGMPLKAALGLAALLLALAWITPELLEAFERFVEIARTMR